MGNNELANLHFRAVRNAEMEIYPEQQRVVELDQQFRGDMGDELQPPNSDEEDEEFLALEVLSNPSLDRHQENINEQRSALVSVMQEGDQDPYKMLRNQRKQ